MDLSLWSKANNWSVDNFKEQVTAISGTLEPAIQSGDTGQRIPFFDEDVHYQVKHRLHMPWTPSYM